MNRALKVLHRHFIPSRHNAYRPRILRRAWLLFFIGVIVATEGSFVSGLAIRQLGAVSLTAAAASAAVQPSPQSFTQSVGRQLVRFTDEGNPAVTWILGAIAALLLVAVALAFFVNIQIQSRETMLSGALVALSALLLIATNMHIAHYL